MRTSMKPPTIRPKVDEFPLLSALLELLLKEENGFRRLDEGEERIESMILILFPGRLINGNGEW